MQLPRAGAGGATARRAGAGRSRLPALGAGAAWRPRATGAALCGFYVTLSSSGPVLLDWVRLHHGGTFPFSIPALTFHAYAVASGLGLAWALSKGRRGLEELARPDMLWRFCVTTSLFTVGDILSFMSLQHIDVGTFSLVGKASAIVLTVFFARVLLRRRQSSPQYALVVAIAVATVAFCSSEAHARRLVGGLRPRGVSDVAVAWPAAGMAQRLAAVACTSLAAVLQERLLTREPRISFLLQQCWMGCGAMITSLLTLRVLHGLPLSYLWRGFDNWRVLVLLAMYVANGLAAGLMVKRLGAVAKALCVPVYLGFCYAYAVRTGSAALTVPVVAAWLASTALIVLYAVASAIAGRSAAKNPQIPR